MKITQIKNFITLILAIAFVNIAAVNAAPALNDDNAKKSNIAIIDLENVLKNCDAMKDAQKKIGKKQESFQKEINDVQKKLEKDDKLLASKKTTLKEEAFKKEQDKLSKKVDDLKELVDSRQESLKKLSLDAVSEINDNIKKIVDKIKDEKDLDAILLSTSTVFYKDNLDISDEVTKRLNKTFSKVKIGSI